MHRSGMGSLLALTVLSLTVRGVAAQGATLANAQPQDAESRAATRAESQPTAPPVVQQAAEPYEVRGSVSVSYRGRLGGDDNDEDLYGYLSLDGGRSGKDGVLFHVFGRATYDLDGDADSALNPFFELNDVFGDELDVKLYEAWAALEGPMAPRMLGVKRIRAGRQQVFAGFSYLIDGARVDFDPIEEAAGLEISVYGGVPEYLYDTSRSGDWLAGADASFRPFDSTRVDLRYAHVADRNDYFGEAADLDDDYASIAVRQALFERRLNLAATWNTIDAATRDASLRLAFESPDYDYAIRALYRYQASIEHEFTAAYDPYVGLLGDSFAHHEAEIAASRFFGEHFAADAGVHGRILNDGDDEGPFNREFIRSWLTLSSIGWPSDDLDVEVTGELWRANEDQTAAAGGQVMWRPTTALRLRFGTFFSVYKYDLFVVDERQDATTFFVDARWTVGSGIRLDGRYEFETGDEGDFHTVRIGFLWQF